MSRQACSFAKGAILPDSRTSRWILKICVGVLFVSWATGIAHAQGQPPDSPSAQRIFFQANEQYRRGHYDKAAQGYQRLLEQGVENGILYYNLGNALLKSGKKGEALWAYEKARAFMPGDSDLASNLNYARSLLSPGVNASVTTPRLVRWLTLNRHFATSVLAFWLGGMLWLAALCWILCGWLPKLRKSLRPLGWLLSLAAGAFLAALIVQTSGVDHRARGVVVSGPVEVKFSPQLAGTTHYELPEGSLVDVLGREFGWIQVRRSDGRSGWVSKDAVKVL